MFSRKIAGQKSGNRVGLELEMEEKSIWIASITPCQNEIAGMSLGDESSSSTLT